MNARSKNICQCCSEIKQQENKRTAFNKFFKSKQEKAIYKVDSHLIVWKIYFFQKGSFKFSNQHETPGEEREVSLIEEAPHNNKMIKAVHNFVKQTWSTDVMMQKECPVHHGWFPASLIRKKSPNVIQKLQIRNIIFI